MALSFGFRELMKSKGETIATITKASTDCRTDTAQLLAQSEARTEVMRQQKDTLDDALAVTNKLVEMMTGLVTGTRSNAEAIASLRAQHDQFTKTLDGIILQLNNLTAQQADLTRSLGRSRPAPRKAPEA